MNGADADTVTVFGSMHACVRKRVCVYDPAPEMCVNIVTMLTHMPVYLDDHLLTRVQAYLRGFVCVRRQWIRCLCTVFSPWWRWCEHGVHSSFVIYVESITLSRSWFCFWVALCHKVSDCRTLTLFIWDIQLTDKTERWELEWAEERRINQWQASILFIFKEQDGERWRRQYNNNIKEEAYMVLCRGPALSWRHIMISQTKWEHQLSAQKGCKSCVIKARCLNKTHSHKHTQIDPPEKTSKAASVPNKDQSWIFVFHSRPHTLCNLVYFCAFLYQWQSVQHQF